MGRRLRLGNWQGGCLPRFENKGFGFFNRNDAMFPMIATL